MLNLQPSAASSIGWSEWSESVKWKKEVRYYAILDTDGSRLSDQGDDHPNLPLPTTSLLCFTVVAHKHPIASVFLSQQLQPCIYGGRLNRLAVSAPFPLLSPLRSLTALTPHDRARRTISHPHHNSTARRT